MRHATDLRYSVRSVVFVIPEKSLEHTESNDLGRPLRPCIVLIRVTTSNEFTQFLTPFILPSLGNPVEHILNWGRRSSLHPWTALGGSVPLSFFRKQRICVFFGEDLN